LCGHVLRFVSITWVMMSTNPGDSTILAYETHVRYVPGGEWLTIAVRASRRAAEREPLCHRDAWGRTPTEVRIVAVHASRSRRAA
jgi:hypothetical protein